MKKMIFCTAMLFWAIAFNSAFGQVRLNVNANIGSQPQWGPSGYNYVDYYYLPDIETYYYVPTRQFIYLSEGNWVYAYNLPPVHRSYNLYNGYKVVINQPKPYIYHSTYRVKYAKYKGNKGQGNLKFKNTGRGKGRGRGRN